MQLPPGSTRRVGLISGLQLSQASHDYPIIDTYTDFNLDPALGVGLVRDDGKYWIYLGGC